MRRKMRDSLGRSNAIAKRRRSRALKPSSDGLADFLMKSAYSQRAIFPKIFAHSLRFGAEVQPRRAHSTPSASERQAPSRARQWMFRSLALGGVRFRS